MDLKQTLSRCCPEAYEWLQDKYRSRVIKRHSSLSEAEQVVELGRLYNEKSGHDVDFSNPKRYTEKIQWRKLFGLTPEMSRLSDKYAVREWVSEKIGEEHLIPLIGVWDSVEDIDFDTMPQSFVLKTNNASGTNIIVPDISLFNIVAAKRRLKRWMDMQYGWLTFEKQYLAIKPRIIAEKFMIDSESNDLADYKFLCFHGVPKYVWVDSDRHANHKRAVFDMNWKLAEWNQFSYGLPLHLPTRPDSFEEMKTCAEVLCEGFSHVRVDFYTINGKVYFGEMTFTNGSGFEQIEPDEYDYILGSMWNEPC